MLFKTPMFFFKKPILPNKIQKAQCVVDLFKKSGFFDNSALQGVNQHFPGVA